MKKSTVVKICGCLATIAFLHMQPAWAEEPSVGNDANADESNITDQQNPQDLTTSLEARGGHGGGGHGGGGHGHGGHGHGGWGHGHGGHGHGHGHGWRGYGYGRGWGWHPGYCWSFYSGRWGWWTCE